MSSHVFFDICPMSCFEYRQQFDYFSLIVISEKNWKYRLNIIDSTAKKYVVVKNVTDMWLTRTMKMFAGGTNTTMDRPSSAYND